MCIIAIIYHLSVQFLNIDVPEISGKLPKNPGNLLFETSVFFPETSLYDRL
jgi:hypothetical protein